MEREEAMSRDMFTAARNSSGVIVSGSALWGNAFMTRSPSTSACFTMDCAVALGQRRLKPSGQLKKRERLWKGGKGQEKGVARGGRHVGLHEDFRTRVGGGGGVGAKVASKLEGVGDQRRKGERNCLNVLLLALNPCRRSPGID
jgi:hypothetical protein